MLMNLLRQLRLDFWGTLARWQDQRPIWLLGGLAALFLEIFSFAFFQTFLQLNPCELCVYIRFSMIVIFLGAMVSAINPKITILKISSYIIIIWGIARGLLWNIELEIENLRAAANDGLSTCSPTLTRFPFDLPLADWFPAHFMPLALCGEDSNWSFIGLNMAEWLFFIYAIFAIGILLMITSWIKNSFFTNSSMK